MVRPAFLEPLPFVRRCRSRLVEKVLSMGMVVRRCGGRIAEVKTTRSSARGALSRARGCWTSSGPAPVMTDRAGRSALVNDHLAQGLAPSHLDRLLPSPPPGTLPIWWTTRTANRKTPHGGVSFLPVVGCCW